MSILDDNLIDIIDDVIEEKACIDKIVNFFYKSTVATDRIYSTGSVKISRNDIFKYYDLNTVINDPQSYSLYYSPSKYHIGTTEFQLRIFRIIENDPTLMQLKGKAYRCQMEGTYEDESGKYSCTEFIDMSHIL